MRTRVIRNHYSEAVPVADPLEAIRAAADPDRFARARRTGERIKGATIAWVHASLHRVAVGLNDGRRLCVEPTPAGEVAWTLEERDAGFDLSSAHSDLLATGEIEFCMPQGHVYTWRWRHIRDRFVGAVIVMCSAERRVFNLHCGGFEVEFDCYEIESAGATDRIVVFAPF